MAQKPQTESEPPKKRGMLLIIVTLVVVLVGAGGGAAWFFLKPADQSAAAKPKPAIFLPLEMFTANLTPDAQSQFIQVAVTLKMDDPEAVALIKERMPEVRNRILLILSGQRGADLLPLAGKQKLAAEIATGVRGVIAPALKAAPKPKAEESEEELTEEETDGGEARPKKARRAPAARPAMEVLFTSFMIQ